MMLGRHQDISNWVTKMQMLASVDMTQYPILHSMQALALGPSFDVLEFLKQQEASAMF